MYAVYDWAGNLIECGPFKTFDDGWDFIVGELTDRLGLTEEDYEDYQVLKVVH